MKRFFKFFINIFSIVVASFLQFPATAQEDVASIIRRSSEANTRDWTAAPEFDNYERDRNKDGDRTYAVTMLYGSPYQRLIAVNGNPLPPANQKEEEAKYDKAVKERQRETPRKRSQRIREYQAERKRDRILVEQMTAAFEFQMVGTTLLDGYNVYELKAIPRRGYKPPNRDSQVLTGMEGTLWIDQKTFQWVKVEAHVIHPVRIYGFLAEVQPGTSFEVEKKPVAGDLWMTSHYAMKSNARVMLFVPHRGEEDDSFFNYQKSAKAANKSFSSPSTDSALH